MEKNNENINEFKVIHRVPVFNEEQKENLRKEILRKIHKIFLNDKIDTKVK